MAPPDEDPPPDDDDDVVPPDDDEPPVAAGAQVPLVAPAGTTQGDPAQQSAVVVHAPPLGMQAMPLHTKGGVPAGFGTHGWLQQSALVAHAVPAGGGPFVVQS